jgi:hypothetical protein
MPRTLIRIRRHHDFRGGFVCIPYLSGAKSHADVTHLPYFSIRRASKGPKRISTAQRPGDSDLPPQPKPREHLAQRDSDPFALWTDISRTDR